MSETGLRERIYLGGYTISRNPSQFEQTPGWAEDGKRFVDGTLSTHRLVGSYVGAPKRISKITWKLAWMPPQGSLSAADVTALNELIADGIELDFCPWLPVCESFAVTDSAATSGTLSRRDALRIVSPLPTNASTRYATVGTRNGSVYSTITLGTVDAAYRTPWTCSTASTGTRVRIHYYPVYRVQFGDNQPFLSIPHVEGMSLILKEV